MTYFVFGNHKHWTGMVWEWGEDTLVNSTNALRRVIEETGLKGGLNFDGKGVEQLAVFDPPSIAVLRRLLDEGSIEIWGGTYTQPYGGLIGHESNVRQRVHGIRAFENILGSRPWVFCEEEFDFFPQLPQVLKQLGYECALLFPQHTWHAPTFPREESAMITLRGVDGSMICAVPYSRRCLMRGVPTAMNALEDPLLSNGGLMITWLEMLDKPNWMWRTDFLLKYLHELRPYVKGVLLSEWIGDYAGERPERQYTLDDYFHGVSVGKNGDSLPRLWRSTESALLRAEFLAAWCSFLGQPYPQYDSYPEWQIEEAWRNLCVSQGHDAYECQGLTDFAGRRFAQMGAMLAKDVTDRCKRHLNEVSPPCFNAQESVTAATLEVKDGLLCGGLLAEQAGLPRSWRVSGETRSSERDKGLFVTTEIAGPGAKGTLRWHMQEGRPALGQLTLRYDQRPEPGIEGATLLPIRLSEDVRRWRVDSPFAVTEVHPNGEWVRRHPTGHWLTSTQAEEWLPKPVTHLSFAAMETEAGGLQYITRQNPLSLAKEDGLDSVVFAYDSWDQDNWQKQATIDFAIAPFDDATNLQLLKTAATAWGDPFSHNGATFLEVEGTAFVTGIRKVGEELEIRLFETEGAPGEAVIGFLWQVESVRAITLLGEESDVVAQAKGREVLLPLGPRQIVTLRILFEGKRTEYLDIDRYREIWVGD